MEGIQINFDIHFDNILKESLKLENLYNDALKEAEHYKSMHQKSKVETVLLRVEIAQKDEALRNRDTVVQDRYRIGLSSSDTEIASLKKELAKKDELLALKEEEILALREEGGVNCSNKKSGGNEKQNLFVEIQLDDDSDNDEGTHHRNDSNKGVQHRRRNNIIEGCKSAFSLRKKFTHQKNAPKDSGRSPQRTINVGFSSRQTTAESTGCKATDLERQSSLEKIKLSLKKVYSQKLALKSFAKRRSGAGQCSYGKDEQSVTMAAMVTNKTPGGAPNKVDSTSGKFQKFCRKFQCGSK